jgi:GT2 family glycosyltransferase
VRAASGPAPNPDALAVEIRRRLGPVAERTAWPPVSIVVINRNGVGHLRRLLCGLSEHTDYPDMELILVDNGSTDDSLDFARRVSAPFPISLLVNHHNESFSDACNQGAGLASGELLLFLNNDVEPFEPGWLRELVACLDRDGVAAVGPTSIEPVEAGASPCGFAIQQRGLTSIERQGLLVPGFRDHGADPLGEGFGRDLEGATISACCLLIDRDSFEAVGGFTHGYMYGVEDIDLVLKLRERGLGSVCSGRSFLIHRPGGTLSAVSRAQNQAWQRVNRKLFWSRWGPRARREYELEKLEEGRSQAGRAELEALGYCLKAYESSAATALLDDVCAALRRRGHRCAVLVGDEVDGLEGLNYDVAVHLQGGARYILQPAQLNVLWSIGEPAAAVAGERSRYELVVTEPDATVLPLDGQRADRLAARLIESVDSCAAEIGFRTRIDGRHPSGVPGTVQRGTR